MFQTEVFDLVILGSGAGGKLLAWHAGHMGQRVAVVERKWIGGSCPNIACLPSKNVIWSAKAVHLTRHIARYGAMTGPVNVNMAAVRKRKQDMVEREVADHLQAYSASGVELILGERRFVGPKALQVRLNGGGTRILTGDKMFVNVGTRAAIPNVPGLAPARALTHIEALELDYLPSHLIVLGGGYVGLELAQAYRRFGSRVTIVEHGSQLMGREDPDVANEVQQILIEEGIQLLLDSKVLRVTGRSGEVVTLTVHNPDGEKNIEGSDILAAAGRIPSTDGIGLQEAGIAMDDRGYIRVNERLETTMPGVWAIGECAGSPQFTHVSADDFLIIKDNLAGGDRSTRDRLVPYCMFTDPPLAHVGLTERDAHRQNLNVRVAKLPMDAVLRSHATGETHGFMKVLIDAAVDRIVGFTMVGAEAGEVMSVVQTAMLAELPYTKLRNTIIAHPTMAEGLGFLLAKVPPRSGQTEDGLGAPVR